MRKPPGVSVERLRKRDTDEFKRLREQAARWPVDNGGQLVDAEPQVPDTLHDRASDNWHPLLAIADRVGGDWPALARKAAIELSGSQDDGGSLNVLLLTHVREAFGSLDQMRSADLVTDLVANAEWPWATWGKNAKPITQHQLGRLLSHFGLTSETIHIPGWPDAKGYKRVHLDPVWEAYCPVRSPSPSPDGFSKRPTVLTPVESAQVGDFRSVQNPIQDTSKNGNLSYSHADLDAWTLQKEKSGGEAGSDQAETAPTVPPLPTCACCGKADPAPNEVAFDGLTVWLHARCEKPYMAMLAGAEEILRRRPS